MWFGPVPRVLSVLRIVLKELRTISGEFDFMRLELELEALTTAPCLRVGYRTR